MNDYFYLSQRQLDRIKPYFPKAHSVPRDIGRTKGGLNSKLHAVCDGHGRPVLMHLTAGQVSDYKGAEKIIG